MEIAVIIAVAIAVALAYALHAILLLRWCGMWTRNRRLVLWVSQMLFPVVTGGAAIWAGGLFSFVVLGEQIWLDWTATPAIALRWAAWVLPALLGVTCAFVLGPACAMTRHWLVWGSMFSGVAAGFAGAFGGALLWRSDEYAVLASASGWHLGALGAPLAFAWPIRTKRKRALGGRACLDCGYDLAGVTLPRCPECGAKRKEPTEEH
jgi:hypothetical protein